MEPAEEKTTQSRCLTRAETWNSKAQGLDAHGIPREYLRQLHEMGELERTGRGPCVLSDREVTENHRFALAAKRIPRGVISLLSALCFHELTTQLPFEVWMTIEVKAWTPKVDSPRMRFIRASDTTRIRLQIGIGLGDVVIPKPRLPDPPTLIDLPLAAATQNKMIHLGWDPRGPGSEVIGKEESEVRLP
ncbi:MAG: hypothetical protein GY722_03950 [bacterium]|nr:hypothetical protein [bacterium]